MNAHESAAVDYNALDDTLGGRLIQAAFIVGFYGVADVTPHVVAARAGLAVANLATIAAFNAFDEDPANDLTSIVDSAQRVEGTPAKTWALLGGLTAGAVGATLATAKLHRACAAGLARRGVKAPWTLMGTVVGAGYLVYKAVAPER